MANGEYIVACIDNSAEAYLRGTYDAQIVALKHYCKTKLAGKPNTVVTVLSMASHTFTTMPNPGTNYKTIKLYLSSKIRHNAGVLLFQESIQSAGALCNAECPPHMQKRILFLVGSDIASNVKQMKSYGEKLKFYNIAVDIVSFYLGGKHESTIINKYVTEELDALFGGVDCGNSHIKHVKRKDVKPCPSSIHEVLSESIFSPSNGADGEFIIACVDDSREAYLRGTFEAQIVALEHYCETKFADKFETEVILFLMASRKFHVRATNTKEILRYLAKIHPRTGSVQFREVLVDAVDKCISICPPNKQNRILFLVGSPVNTTGAQMRWDGEMLRDATIAVDIVTFYLINPYNNKQCGTKELDILFGAANSGDSHIKHVEPNDLKPRTSSIRKVLSKSIFSPSSKTNHHEKEKGKSPAAGDNKHVGSEAVPLENEGVKLGKRKRFRRSDRVKVLKSFSKYTNKMETAFDLTDDSDKGTSGINR